MAGLANRIALIDYRAGNLTSVRKAFAALGAELFTPESAGQLADAAAIVVPGVGHFGATRALGPEWIEMILARVGEGRPLLGICLGMQWLYESSEEAPDCRGLGLLGGRCYRLGNGSVRLPPDVKMGADAWRMGPMEPSPRMGQGFGLGFAVRLDQGRSPLPGSPNDYFWAGASGTYFWHDPRERLYVVWMVQVPDQAVRARYRALVRDLVYQALIGN